MIEALKAFRPREYAWLLDVLSAQLAPIRLKLLLLLTLGVASSLVGLAMPLFAGEFADLLLVDSGVGFYTPALMLLALLVVRTLLDYWGGYLDGSTNFEFGLGLQETIYDRMQRLPLGATRLTHRGDYIAMFQSDAWTLVTFVFQTLLGLLPTLLTFVGAFFMMMTIDPLVAALALILIPVFVVITRLMSRRIRPVSEAAYNFQGQAFGLFEDNAEMLPLIKSSVSEARELERFRRLHKRIYDINMEQLRLQLLLTPATRLTGGVALLLALVLTTQVGGVSTVGDVVSFMLYGLMLTGPLGSFANIYGEAQSALAAVSRLDRLLAPAVEELNAGQPLHVSSPPAITLDQLCFSYRPDAPVLTYLSAQIEPGELVIITGANGVGKSTLAALLCRFAEPDHGRILFNDADLSRAPLRDVRSSIGLVYQNMALFDRTVRENLAYPEDEVDVVEAVQHTGLLDFVAELEDGVETAVGPNGQRLSGGQRQRIALARVLIQQPPVMLLDEAMSMLDKQCFASVKELLLSSQATRIVIDHDLSKWKGCGRVIDLSDMDGAQ